MKNFVPTRLLSEVAVATSNNVWIIYNIPIGYFILKDLSKKSKFRLIRWNQGL